MHKEEQGMIINYPKTADPGGSGKDDNAATPQAGTTDAAAPPSAAPTRRLAMGPGMIARHHTHFPAGTTNLC